MRITNTMMTNTTMRNVNKSKTNLYTTEQQMASQKKISKPSDDPIIAIRALSLRTSLAEVEQYLKKNVPDAKAWIKLTETSLDNMDGIYTDLVKLCTQGENDTFETTNRQAIVQSIQQYKEAMYAEGNADSSGRYIFTGYRTDRSLTFLNSTETQVSYKINQNFTGEDFTTAKYMKNSVDINNIASVPSSATPETKEVYRLRLAYDNCAYDAADADTVPSITVDGKAYTGTVAAVSSQELEQLITAGNMADDTAYYVYDKGEIAFSENTYKTLKGASDISVQFRKDEFEKGDIRPEHYFDCEDLTNGQVYTLGDNQDIEYTINFSQTLTVNTLGCNAFDTSI